MNKIVKMDELQSCMEIANTNVEGDAPDWLNQRGALALARRLQDFWHSQGYTEVRFWTEPVDERFAKVGTYEIYKVVCNLENGLPPRYANR